MAPPAPVNPASADDTLPCPICKKLVAIPAPDAVDRGYFPFCSERCRTIDLGRWLSGAYQIPVKDTDDDEERESPLPE